MTFWIRKNGGKTDDTKFFKDDEARLISSKSEANFLNDCEVSSSTCSKEFKNYFDGGQKKDLLTHACDFVTNKYCAFSFGRATNNISESMNHVLKPAASHKELPLDALILALREMQGVYLYDFKIAVSGFCDYQLKEKLFYLAVHHFDLHIPHILKLDTIVQEIAKEDKSCPTVEKRESYRMTQRALARWCVQRGFIGFFSTTGSFSVLSHDCKRVHSVKYFPKPVTYSCPSAGTCYHISSVEIALRDQTGKDTATYALSILRKRNRGKETSKFGRKKPRTNDYDCDVVLAPDAENPKSRSLLIKHSTPKKQKLPDVECTSEISFDQATLQKLNLSNIEDMSEIAENLSGIWLQQDHDMMHHVHEVNFSTYPWLMPTSDLISAQTDTDRKYSCLEGNQ